MTLENSCLYDVDNTRRCNTVFDISGICRSQEFHRRIANEECESEWVSCASLGCHGGTGVRGFGDWVRFFDPLLPNYLGIITLLLFLQNISCLNMYYHCGKNLYH